MEAAELVSTNVSWTAGSRVSVVLSPDVLGGAVVLLLLEGIWGVQMHYCVTCSVLALVAFWPFSGRAVVVVGRFYVDSKCTLDWPVSFGAFYLSVCALR